MIKIDTSKQGIIKIAQQRTKYDIEGITITKDRGFVIKTYSELLSHGYRDGYNHFSEIILTSKEFQAFLNEANRLVKKEIKRSDVS